MILGVAAIGVVPIVSLILVLMLAWNYIKLLFEAGGTRMCCLCSGIYRAGRFQHGGLPSYRGDF